MLLTRSADLRQARQTSVVKDIRIWVDGPDADPATELRDALRELDCAGKRLGVEYDAHGLTAANGKRLDPALQGFCHLDDAQGLVRRQRAAKSAAATAYVRPAHSPADRRPTAAA